MATASHAAGLELWQTVWVMKALGEYGLEGFERYRLITTIIIAGSRFLAEQPAMVDKAKRLVAANLIEEFVSCRITNFKFRDLLYNNSVTGK
jgi:hypothetical protein